MIRSRRSICALVLTAIALLPVCGCALPIPAIDRQLLDAASACGSSADQVTHGRALMVTACAACHVPIQPVSYSMIEWDDALPRMLRKSHLAPADGVDIRAYVVAARRAAIVRDP